MKVSMVFRRDAMPNEPSNVRNFQKIYDIMTQHGYDVPPWSFKDFEYSLEEKEILKKKKVELTVTVVDISGNRIPESDAIRLYDGTYDHKDNESKYFRDGINGKYYPVKDKRKIRKKLLLGSSFTDVSVHKEYFETKCSQCPETRFFYRNEDFITTFNGSTVSKEAAVANYIQCSDCGKYFPKRGRHFSESNIAGVCNSCVERRLESPFTWCRDFYPYNANVIGCIYGESYRYRSPSKHVLPIGLEIEQQYSVDNRSQFSSIIQRIYDYLGKDYVIVKHDGSLVKGAEIVTIPQTKNFHLNKFDGFFSTFASELGTYGDSVGLHVHVNKSSLSALTIGKLQVFLNLAHNRDFIIDIAGRTCPDFAGFNEHAKITTRFNSKYVALRVTRNTVEFRIFKSPKSFSKLAVRLDFVESLIRFCENSSIRELSFENYIKFVTDTKYNYIKKYVLNYS